MSSFRKITLENVDLALAYERHWERRQSALEASEVLSYKNEGVNAAPVRPPIFR